MSAALIQTARLDLDVSLKNVTEYASICLDCLYKLPKAVAVAQLGHLYDRQQAGEHRHTFDQQLESFISTLKECYHFSDNVNMLRENFSVASAKEVRALVEEMGAAGKKIHSQVLASTARLHQYSQASPYDNVWPVNVKHDANKALLDGPTLQTQFKNSIKGLLISFNHISDFWNEQDVALKASLSGKDTEFGLTADQAITLANRWARYSPVIMETIHSLVKICDALKVEPELRQSSETRARAAPPKKDSLRLIGASPNPGIERAHDPQHRSSTRSKPGRRNNDPTIISGSKSSPGRTSCSILTPAIKLTSLVLFAFALGPNSPMTREEIERSMPKYSSRPPLPKGQARAVPKNKHPTASPAGLPQAKSSSTSRRGFFGLF